MKIKKMGWFLSLFPIAGITLAPFGIFIKEKYLTNNFIKNHESIHWKQQIEMILLGTIISLITIVTFLCFKTFSLWLLISIIFPFFLFYILYLIEWFIKIFFYGNKAYVNLSSEREAYANEYNLEYLKTRKHYAWLTYIFKKA
jgi:hypothetical protein